MIDEDADLGKWTNIGKAIHLILFLHISEFLPASCTKVPSYICLVLFQWFSI